MKGTISRESVNDVWVWERRGRWVLLGRLLARLTSPRTPTEEKAAPNDDARRARTPPSPRSSFFLAGREEGPWWILFGSFRGPRNCDPPAHVRPSASKSRECLSQVHTAVRMTTHRERRQVALTRKEPSNLSEQTRRHQANEEGCNDFSTCFGGGPLIDCWARDGNGLGVPSPLSMPPVSSLA